MPDFITSPHKGVTKLRSRFKVIAAPRATGRLSTKFDLPSPSEDWKVPESVNKPPKLTVAKRPFPPPPAKFEGTEPEWAIYWSLTRLQCTFVFQQSFWYGRKQIGGAIADFTVTAPVTIVIRVQGEYWHYGMGSDKEEADLIQKMRFEADGFPCIDIDEEDALAAPMYYTKEALLGIDHSKGARS